MATPSVTCGADIVDVSGSIPRLCNLTATATGSPSQWRWTILSVPVGSVANVGTNGNFTNGVATVQNPSFTADIDGGTYVVQAEAQNVDGWSDPTADKQSGQQCVVIKTADLLLTIPGAYQFAWSSYLNDTLKLLELAAAVVPTHATSHKSGGSDEVKLDELADPTDITTLNSNSSRHGLLPKLSGLGSDVLKGDGTWGSGVDTSAIHKATAAEISIITAKTTPATTDILLIEDSADSYNKKSATIASVVSGGLQLGWKYLPTTQPAGATAPNAVWQLDGTANQFIDRVGGVMTLVENNTPGVGRPVYGVNEAGHRGSWFSQSRLGNYYLKGDTSAAWAPVRISGNLTLEVVLTCTTYASLGYAVGCGQNILANQYCHYGLYANGGLYEFWQADAGYGSARAHSITVRLYPISVAGTVHLLVTRAGSSTLTTYFNGVKDPGVVTGVPGGAGGNGTQSIFNIGAIQQGANISNNGLIVHSVRITPAVYSDAQALAAWHQVKPL